MLLLHGEDPGYEANISMKKVWPRCHVKSPTGQDVFQPKSGVINCAGVTREGGMLILCKNGIPDF